MESWKGRPEITPADHPVTIYKALLGSIALWYKELSEESGWYWTKTAQDAWEAIQHHYGIISPDEAPLYPNGRYPKNGEKVRLYMSMDQLEYILVGYGASLIETGTEENSDEIKRIDDILCAIDKVHDRKKY